MSSLSQILAPFIPFLAEEIFRKLNAGAESVHLSDWPKVEKKNIDNDLEEKMKLVQELVTFALAERSKAGIKVRQPLPLLKIKNKKIEKEKELIELLKEEINVKEVSFDDKITNAVELDVTITEELKKEGELREVLRNYKDLRKQDGLTPTHVICASATTESIISLINEGVLKEIGAQEIKILSLEEMSSEGYISKEIEIDGKKNILE